MTPIVWTYIVYIALSIPLTIWVAQTLHKNGRIFLIDSFRGNERLADSVNHLLVVGFYLINIGYVALALKERIAPTDVREVLETVSRKIGAVMLVLGVNSYHTVLVIEHGCGSSGSVVAKTVFSASVNGSGLTTVRLAKSSLAGRQSVSSWSIAPSMSLSTPSLHVGSPGGPSGVTW